MIGRDNKNMKMLMKVKTHQQSFYENTEGVGRHVRQDEF